MKLNNDMISKLKRADEHFDEKYGICDSESRKEFEAKAQAWYYAELLKEERKKRKITQQQLANMMGKKREYISILERGEIDMQLSTFLSITNALGLKFGVIL